MNRSAVLLTSLLALSSVCSVAQTLPTSDPQALALVAKSLAALTAGIAVPGVTLNATVISIAGSDYFTGTATLQAQGTKNSRVDLSVNGTTRTEIRTASGDIPSGSWVEGSAAATQFAQHNCWTDAVWFFPALTSLTQGANPNFVFSYVGQEQHDNLTVQHVRVLQHLALDTANSSPVGHLSTMDLYLDPVSFLPLALAFNVHADRDMNIDIPVEVRFAGYQLVNGVQVPFHVQRLMNGSLALDLTVTSATLNSTLPIGGAQIN